MDRFVQDIEGVSERATGMPPVFMALVEIIGRDGRNAVLLTLVIVFVLLIIDFRSPRLALMAMILAIIISVFGVLSAFIITTITYFLWGSIFAMELLLFYNGSQSAKEWFVARYDFRTFKLEYYAFYPLMFLLYILLEFIPHLFSKEQLVKFAPSEVLKEMETLLK